MKNITIQYDDKGLSLKLDQPESPENLINILNQSLLSVIDQTIQTHPDHEADIRREFYHSLNAQFSAMLEFIDPSSSQHPTLTEAAILLAENQILDEAEKSGMTLEEYLPFASAKAEEKLVLFKRNQEGRKRHNIRLRNQERRQ